MELSRKAEGFIPVTSPTAKTQLIDKKFVFPASQDVNKLTFIINTEKGSYKEIFDVAVKTNTVSEVSVTKK